MCGIAGAVGFVDDVVQDAVRAMSEALKHRGPDSEGVWSDVERGTSSPQGCVLAHRRLAIVDLSDAGHQPMHDPLGQVIAFNGEVYNYRELRDELCSKDETFISDCDTEVVLRMLANEGPACVDRFNGMFALACWDPKAKVLHLVRDRVGIKPLYYAEVKRHGGTCIIFASEVRAILASGLIARHIDPAGLDSYLYNGFVVGPRTLIQGVSLLGAGTSLPIRAGEILGTPTRYWKLPDGRGERTSFAQAKTALEASVKRRLMADVPLGVFLSGGIDSSAVAAIASRVAPDAVHTFNIGFPEAEFDESGYAQTVADQLGTKHTCIELTQSHFQSHLEEALRGIDQPTFDAINTYFVSRAVREAGVTVALAGTGGDELFGGYTSFRDLPDARKWARRASVLPQPLVGLVAKAMVRIKTGMPGEVPPQTRWGKLADVLSTQGNLVDLYQVSYALYTDEFLDDLRRPGRDVTFGLPSTMHELLVDTVNDSEELHAISMLEMSCFIGQRLMRDTDAASMAVSLEARVPLLDHELIETVANLEPNERFDPLGSKSMLRRMALDGLDPATFDRPKSGFVLPIDTWVRQGLKDQLEETLHDCALCESVGIDADAVARLWSAFQNGAPGLYWSRLWALFVLLWWCREHEVAIG